MIVKQKVCRITIFLCAALLILMSLSMQVLSEQDQENNEVVLATINGEVISLETFESFWNIIPDSYKVQLNKEDVLEQIITQTLLIQKADELNLREDPDLSFQIKNAIDQILIQSLLEKEIIEKTDLTEKDIEDYYEENKETYWHDEEIHALNILVETEEEAEDIIKKIESGEDFASLAENHSIASSASNGGDIGFISKGTLRSEIEEKLFILEPEEVSEIIPVENGFHIFKVVEKNPSGYLEINEVKNEIETQLLPVKQQQAFDEYLKNIEENAIIEKNIELLSEEENNEPDRQEQD
ncbi:MAG: peptidyl-prolyl cis-trans isomerase [Candidatus Caldatribacteriota bacterium]|nr:peptidyl-prolyl cis-trans isomerase [Atribacterota bacterium]MDD3641087.1 peptidyl-prolyl cis-trans isomerase [Atribacterota bacterium]MDD4288297.1 peptidyl-prolyl cis-trans isomerase [Atribacterota bacterium]MDD4765169.1 peptidyl-prolyl cis-trans isomerase [Atribacterota bacterium]MDD5635370.1 peptidyl-prolyl cis-trans isomerase [Atribacterota bacterium]